MIKRLIWIIVIFAVILIGCEGSNVDNTKEYSGEKLEIGVIGDIPKVRETQIAFQEIDFDFLKQDDFDSKYDAIFITKDNLSEASKAEYADIYRNSKIPLFFIENQKSNAAFTIEDLSYEDEPDSNDGKYITGLLYNNGEYEIWRYGLYNDTKSEINIKCVYTRVFEAISEI